MKILHLAITLFIVTLLSACSEPLNEGKIVRMIIEKETKNLVLIPMMIGKTTILNQYLVTDDKDFVLTVRGTNSNGEMKTESWYVTENEYSNYSVGDTVSLLKTKAKTTDYHQKV